MATTTDLKTKNKVLVRTRYILFLSIEVCISKKKIELIVTRWLVSLDSMKTELKKCCIHQLTFNILGTSQATSYTKWTIKCEYCNARVLNSSHCANYLTFLFSFYFRIVCWYDSLTGYLKARSRDMYEEILEMFPECMVEFRVSSQNFVCVVYSLKVGALESLGLNNL